MSNMYLLVIFKVINIYLLNIINLLGIFVTIENCKQLQYLPTNK